MVVSSLEVSNVCIYKRIVVADNREAHVQGKVLGFREAMLQDDL